MTLVLGINQRQSDNGATEKVKSPFGSRVQRHYGQITVTGQWPAEWYVWFHHAVVRNDGVQAEYADKHLAYQVGRRWYQAASWHCMFISGWYQTYAEQGLVCKKVNGIANENDHHRDCSLQPINPFVILVFMSTFKLYLCASPWGMQEVKVMVEQPVDLFKCKPQLFTECSRKAGNNGSWLWRFGVRSLNYFWIVCSIVLIFVVPVYI